MIYRTRTYRTASPLVRTGQGDYTRDHDAADCWAALVAFGLSMAILVAGATAVAVWSYMDSDRTVAQEVQGE